MTAPKPTSIIAVSIVVFLLGLTMFGYWTKYILDGMPLENIPIISEGMAAILALITGIGLFRQRKWSLPTGLVLCGLWIYGCVGGINLVLYQLLVSGRLDFQSPVGAWTDAILFFLISAWSVFLAAYLWKMRRLFSAGFSATAARGANDA